MKAILLFFIVCFCTTAHAQCSSGNCISGKGIYDFGWCTYSGEFKNGKPDGAGTMRYDDYTFTGSFKNGVEDGDGVITKKDGSKENVRYVNGIRYAPPVVRIAAADYKPLQAQDVNCLSGDCINGFGTYQFQSGNKYTGNFKNYKREGQGTFYFQNGDQFTGTWANNTEKEGTYSFASGPTYTGTYDGEGHELNGEITVGTRVIPFVDGKAIIPPAPEVSNSDDEGADNTAAKTASPRHERVHGICHICGGTGKSHFTIPGGGYTFDRYGNRETVFGEYTTCILCGGTGVEP